jgi:hypothetical protein
VLLVLGMMGVQLVVMRMLVGERLDRLIIVTCRLLS